MKTPLVIVLEDEAEVIALMLLAGQVTGSGPLRDFYDEIFAMCDHHLGTMPCPCTDPFSSNLNISPEYDIDCTLKELVEELYKS